MKKLILLLFFFINLLTFSQEGLTKHMLIGEWVSDDTEYQLIVSSPGNWNNFLFLNYKVNVVYNRSGSFVNFKYVSEKLINRNFTNNKIRTKLTRDKHGKKGEFICIYERVNFNKLKVTVRGECDTVFYYTRKN